MIVVSLALNIVVLVAVSSAMIRGAGWVRAAFGPRSPARDILLAIYITILLASIGLLVTTTCATAAWHAGALAALLGVQVAYKAITALAVHDSLRNPVVLSNLGIAAVHTVTLVTVLPTL